MPNDDLAERLSRISTRWTLLFQAHQCDNPEATARGQILAGYARFAKRQRGSRPLRG